ncbi:hypothetical protein G6F56_014234 [Rhizopus delemar]|nr:hypothetical protein G6F56_014234 [Rhizopus delemar]
MDSTTTIKGPSKIIKIRKPKDPKLDNKKEKTIKIKLTAKEKNYERQGSDDDEEPEAAVEEQLIFRVPEGAMCEKLHELVKKREISQDVKLNFKGKI